MVYNNNAYTLTAIYHDRILRLYAHRPIKPSISGDSTEYRITLIDMFGIGGSANTFLRGVTAFRNARECIGKRRDEFVAAANARMQNTATTSVSDLFASSSSIQS